MGRSPLQVLRQTDSHHVTNAVNVPARSPRPANQGPAARLLRRASRKKAI